MTSKLPKKLLSTYGRVACVGGATCSASRGWSGLWFCRGAVVLGLAWVEPCVGCPKIRFAAFTSKLRAGAVLGCGCAGTPRVTSTRLGGLDDCTCLTRLLGLFPCLPLARDWSRAVGQARVCVTHGRPCDAWRLGPGNIVVVVVVVVVVVEGQSVWAR